MVTRLSSISNQHTDVAQCIGDCFDLLSARDIALEEFLFTPLKHIVCLSY